MGRRNVTTLEGYMTYEDISVKVGVPVATLYVWRARGKLPEPDVLFRQPLWAEATITRWIEEGVHDASV